ncbi:hypothetical protein GLOIN_2v1505665 [Rhizophagus irregularis DAOM 181602=DAOM 197198]|uniref:Uncharacterized protein n=1 Tax=Rhizophagus irregularis (strain DAOM 181602 / DAOM 197198 / MUCL 43194) TaxID=747089 RepID=A0A2P4QV55_RHIID|nr:hypothetical protein GLOIN_2v1505665 [Rhizophagus irregularis DAOM 181602=DAOM 197198]POG81515.1 hypothetical protein GLOIN_2v1505665 [Rhizophagus irregularis DAOM 181602=DAOM 197198]GET64544.1 hypothetical protein GLOIN_2v1505665 [Rhizophagus irregularis DAOM 181602=DAOM 197198]|eukprot:XP_025188381.1 hypothetical protein GLOIN_2v1505665 [Rhizophagus irregularis DAOM 181602=DAOM 197198]
MILTRIYPKYGSFMSLLLPIEWFAWFTYFVILPMYSLFSWLVYFLILLTFLASIASLNCSISTNSHSSSSTIRRCCFIVILP